jgi:hypothetical protein
MLKSWRELKAHLNTLPRGIKSNFQIKSCTIYWILITKNPIPLQSPFLICRSIPNSTNSAQLAVIQIQIMKTKQLNKTTRDQGITWRRKLWSWSRRRASRRPETGTRRPVRGSRSVLTPEMWSILLKKTEGSVNRARILNPTWKYSREIVLLTIRIWSRREREGEALRNPSELVYDLPSDMSLRSRGYIWDLHPTVSDMSTMREYVSNLGSPREQLEALDLFFEGQ